MQKPNFLTKQDHEDFIKQKFPSISNTIINNCATPVYLDNAEDFMNLDFMNEYFFVPSIPNRPYKKGALGENRISTFLTQTIDSTNPQGLENMNKTYFNPTTGGLYYDRKHSVGNVYQTLHVADNSNIVALSKKYLISKSDYNEIADIYEETNILFNSYNASSLSSSFEFVFFNNKVDLGLVMKNIYLNHAAAESKSVFKNEWMHVASTPWYYSSPKKSLTRYTIELDKKGCGYYIWEYNVFQKKVSSRIVCVVKETNWLTASVQLVRNIYEMNRKNKCTIEIYDFDQLISFMNLNTHIPSKSIPDLLLGGEFYYLTDDIMDKKVLTERAKYLTDIKSAEKLSQRKTKKTIEEAIKSTIEKVKKDPSQKNEAVSFLASLFD